MKLRRFASLMAFAAILFSMHAADETQQPVRHVVVFKFSEDATQAQIDKVAEGFRKMSKTIPGIVSYERGVNNSPENLNRGLTHVYLLTFENAAARDAYLPHPDHKAFGKMLGDLGIFEEVFVVDYVPKD